MYNCFFWPTFVISVSFVGSGKSPASQQAIGRLRADLDGAMGVMLGAQGFENKI